MTVQSTVFCDVCAQVVLEDRSLLKVESGPLLAAGYREIDMCKSCGENLVNFVRTAPAHAAV